MAYVYRHIRLDKNEPFYIGIGSDLDYKRANSIHDRNYYWNNIINKTTYEVEILIDNIDIENAKIKEKEFIKLYGRKDLGLGCLCNMTDGGEGCNPSPEVREKLRQSKLGNKNPNYKKVMSQDFRDKISKVTKGDRNPFYGKKHKPGTLVNNCKLVLDLQTGIYYDSMKEAYLVTKYKYKCFKAMLNGQSRNKTSLVQV